MNQLKIRRILALYDACILAMVDILMLVLYRSAETLTASEVLLHTSISAVCIFSARYLGEHLPADLAVWRCPVLSSPAGSGCRGVLCHNYC